MRSNRTRKTTMDVTITKNGNVLPNQLNYLWGRLVMKINLSWLKYDWPTFEQEHEFDINSKIITMQQENVDIKEL